MSFLRRAIAAGFVALIGLPAATAATIEFRPELDPYLESLQEIYLPYPEVDQAENDFDRPSGTLKNITFSGVIEKGDADKLSRLIDAAGYPGVRIVFNSPGGNFLEGIKIGEMLQYNLSSQDPSLAGVYVLKGQSCLSACALAFSLAAATRDVGASNYDGRFIEDGAELGFHMGALPEDQAAQTANVKTIMNLTYSVVAAYAKLIKGNLNPPLLLEKALEYREADSFFYLRGAQRSLSMGFTPVSRSILSAPIYSYAMDMRTVDAVCRTLIMSTRLPKTLVTYSYLFINGDGPTGREISLDEMIELRGSRMIAGGMASGEICYVAQRPDKTVLISVADGSQLRDCTGPKTGSNFDQAWCASDREPAGLMTIALLADTLLCNSGDLQTKFVPWEADFSTGWDNDLLDDPTDWERTIVRDVNMRRSPSLKSDIVAGLPAGAEVKVTGCQLVDDGQGVWYSVRHSTGSGWISARFATGFNSEMRAFTGP
jgi:hypothetical protein